LWFIGGNGVIGRITTSGVFTKYSGGPGILNSPFGIAAGSDGALWFTSPDNNSIGRITTTETVTNYTGSGAG
jgi:virginiamycin B lyase